MLGQAGRERIARAPGALFPELERGAAHDVYAETAADAVSVNGFALGLAVQAAGGRPIVWGLHGFMACEAGAPYGPGLHEMGLDPSRLILIRARDARMLLGVGEDALRCAAVGAVVLSLWGETKDMSLTASRRLALAAQAGGGVLFLARAGARPAPSAAETRWSVRAAPSAPLEANAPGRPAFAATLLRHRGGAAPGTWIVEWDREHACFTERKDEAATLSGGLVPVPTQRAAGAGARRIA